LASLGIAYGKIVDAFSIDLKSGGFQKRDHACAISNLAAVDRAGNGVRDERAGVFAEFAASTDLGSTKLRDVMRKANLARAPRIVRIGKTIFQIDL